MKHANYTKEKHEDAPGARPVCALLHGKFLQFVPRLISAKPSCESVSRSRPRYRTPQTPDLGQATVQIILPTQPHDRATQSPDLGQAIVQIILYSAMQPYTNTKPCESVSKLVHANRGLWARPPVLSPVPMQAIHSHVSSRHLGARGTR